jgi:SAM-dependent methyltransferase
MTKPTSLSYEEVKDHLAIRIRAHTEFANFQLEDWLLDNLEIPTAGVFLEIGCGDGNWFETWARALGPRGLLIGIDKNEELLARAKGRETACQTMLLHMDFNDLSSFLPETFDVAIAPYSIYYADDAHTTMAAIREILKPIARCYLLGPTDANAAELYELNQLIFGFKSDDPTQQRAGRIEAEFLPAAEGIFSEVTCYRVPRLLTFPSIDDYLKYYQATLLFRESCQKAGRTPTPEEIADSGWSELQLSKEIVVLEAQR